MNKFVGLSLIAGAVLVGLFGFVLTISAIVVAIKQGIARLDQISVLLFEVAIVYGSFALCRKLFTRGLRLLK